MNVDVKKLNDFNIFEVIHGGGLYRARLTRMMWWDYPYQYQLEVCYVDELGHNYYEFYKPYKTLTGALKKLENYFKGEKTDWNLL